VIVAGVVAIIGLLTVLAFTRLAPVTTFPAEGQPAVVAPQQDIPYPDVPRISPADTKAKLDSGLAVVVDVRAAQYYQAAHIDGALSIPLGQLEAGQHQLPKNAEIITYCT
jgi:3-mercaptopyruvate sulfurtransferase SseA